MVFNSLPLGPKILAIIEWWPQIQGFIIIISTSQDEWPLDHRGSTPKLISGTLVHRPLPLIGVLGHKAIIMATSHSVIHIVEKRTWASSASAV